ncbi:hypothetical protein [Propionicimonas sp.]|uniref:hypothetical protein n=1 Tax=Propionicimonas sp. TaxID=1955623 RepID=UPI0018368A1E|nr:hypothetical protein [Propionicimonas sp.]MBA3019640.1 hypothetical protein [Propionicimonas sp.]MBU4208015.1 hypothetical protein [Actinomycetota bacterium]MBU4411447.1 hypothetical protein [Actinomycetota bacterium]MCG2805759.1 hypothetical protein [Propionicimonas sp.]
MPNQPGHNDTVVLTIAQVEYHPGGFPVGTITTITTDTAHLYSTADAWAREHVLTETESLTRGIRHLLNPTTPPKDGFAGLINKPTGIFLLAQWPWCIRLPREIQALLS